MIKSSVYTSFLWRLSIGDIKICFIRGIMILKNNLIYKSNEGGCFYFVTIPFSLEVKIPKLWLLDIFVKCKLQSMDSWGIKGQVPAFQKKVSAGQWFSLGTPVSSTYKTDRHDITEILLKVWVIP